MDRATARLTDALAPCTPAWAVAAPGWLWLEVPRSGAATERAFAVAVLEAAASVGHVDARLGLADGAVAARAAAETAGEARGASNATWAGALPARRVPEGGDAAFLGPMPVAALGVSDDVRDVLHTLGVRRVSDVLALPSGSVEARLGPAGRRLEALARGVSAVRPRAPRVGAPDGAFVPLPAPAWSLEAVGFAVRRALSELLGGYEHAGLGAARVVVWLERERGAAVRHEVSAARAHADAGLWWRLVREAMGASSPDAGPEAGAARDGWAADGVVGVRIAVREGGPRSVRQGDLFRDAAAPVARERAWGRLAARLGDGARHVAVAVDTQRPGASGCWAPATFEGQRLVGQQGPRLARADEAVQAAEAPPRADVLAGCVRLVRPAEPLTPACDPRRGERPMAFRRPASAEVLRVAAWSVTERLDGGWWERPWSEEMHWARLCDGRLARIVHDRRLDTWRLDAWLD